MVRMGKKILHNILTNNPQPKAVRVADALAGVRRRDAEIGWKKP